MQGNLHEQFLEGWVGVIPPGYSTLRHNWSMAEILWHRRETRRQTENTNIMPIARKASFYSTKSQPSLCYGSLPLCDLPQRCLQQRLPVDLGGEVLGGIDPLERFP